MTIVELSLAKPSASSVQSVDWERQLMYRFAVVTIVCISITVGVLADRNSGGASGSHASPLSTRIKINGVEVRQSVKNDVSQQLSKTQASFIKAESAFNTSGIQLHESSSWLSRDKLKHVGHTRDETRPITAAGGAVEQQSQGTRPAALLVESFDGLGFGFEGPQGKANVRNPSDNTLAVGPDHIVQIVNSRMSLFTKKGKRFDSTGKVLYGPVVTNAVFAGFGGQCEARNNGDAVVRYDQLAHRWLILMPTFARGAVRSDQPDVPKSGDPAQVSPLGRGDQPGIPFKLAPPPVPNPTVNPNRAAPATQGQGPSSLRDG